MMDANETWRAKVKALCSPMGAAAEAVYEEIVDAVEEWAAEKVQDAVAMDREYRP